MRHVPVFANDLEALDGLAVANYVVEVDGAIFFDPVRMLATPMGICDRKL
jgi:hypothetical protein